MKPGRVHQSHWVGSIDGPPGRSSFVDTSVIPSNSIASAVITQTSRGSIQLPIWTVYQGGNSAHYWWAGYSVWGMVDDNTGWYIGTIG